jgi:excisionase family DNA binding protein
VSKLNDHPGQLVSLPRAAELAGVSPRTIRRLIDDGTLKAKRPRKHWRVSVASLNRLLHENSSTVKLPTLEIDPLDD